MFPDVDRRQRVSIDSDFLDANDRIDGIRQTMLLHLLCMDLVREQHLGTDAPQKL
jgi:hypothetical protein